MNVKALTILLDGVGIEGGAERYWHIVVPALRELGVAVRVIARTIDERSPLGASATEIRWAADDERADTKTAGRIGSLLREVDGATVITASVFDPGVLDAVRANARRWIARIHDHRAFCPNGDRLFPQFSAICAQPAGLPCLRNAVVHGCMHGPHVASIGRLTQRLAVRDRIACADAVLVSSEYMRASAVTNRIEEQRVVVTPPPLSDAAFARAPRSRPARDTVLFSGRLTPQKGLGSLIRSIARIAADRRPAMIVAGTGNDEANARALAVRLGVAVDWRGWLAQRQLRTAIDEATIVAVPSLEAEPFGLVGIEAQARGRPAVAYDVGGIGDWITGAGIAVPRADERALEHAMLEALEPATWQRLSLAARRSSERYRMRPHLERLLAVLDAPPRVSARPVATALA